MLLLIPVTNLDLFGNLFIPLQQLLVDILQFP
jgi:hypothetical protein